MCMTYPSCCFYNNTASIEIYTNGLTLSLHDALPSSRAVLDATMLEHVGGSYAEGRWSVRDAHAALELAQVLFLADESELVTAVSPELARSEEHTSELQ